MLFQWWHAISLTKEKCALSGPYPSLCCYKTGKWVDLTVSELNFLWISWVDNLEEQIISVLLSAFFSWLAASNTIPFSSLRRGRWWSLQWKYSLNPTNRREVELFDTMPGGYPTSFFTDWKTCWGYTCTTCCVTSSFYDLLDGPCCLENLAFLPRGIAGELSRDVCILSLAIGKYVLHVSLSQGNSCSSVLVWGLEPDEGVFLLLQFSGTVWRNEGNRMACSEYPDEE